ncbi:MAG TPA: dTDP-4-dehydrorhamnose 3,5-epimerase [Anaerolineae bacterium]
MAFRVRKMEIPEVLLVESAPMRDARGFFRETYKESELSPHGLPKRFVQDNLAHSSLCVLRGLHYQKLPSAQGKYIFVSEGRIFDVAVDIRKGSPTFGKWVGAELAMDNGMALYVPPEFAHGYCVLSDKATIIYKVTAEYAPEAERGILWNDPDIGITWPIADPILSPKDSRLPPLRLADNNFEYR